MVAKDYFPLQHPVFVVLHSFTRISWHGALQISGKLKAESLQEESLVTRRILDLMCRIAWWLNAEMQSAEP